MKDLIERLKNYKTTIIGIFTAVIALLVTFGVLDPDNTGVESITSILDGVLLVLAGISGIVLMLSKDPKKE